MNPNKTKPNSSSEIDIYVHLMANQMKKVTLNKNLGFWLDDELPAKLAFFYRNKTFIDQNCRKQTVQSTFLHILDYGDDLYALSFLHSKAS